MELIFFSLITAVRTFKSIWAIKNNLHCPKQNGQNNHLNVPISNASDEASLPESLASKVGDTQLQVQINAKGQEISKGNYGVFHGKPENVCRSL